MIFHLKNQLTIDEVTHRLIYTFKLLNFINVRQTSLLYSIPTRDVGGQDICQAIHCLFRNDRLLKQVDSNLNTLIPERPNAIPKSQSVGLQHFAMSRVKFYQNSSY